MLLVSICIPTKDRIEYLKETVASILSDNVEYCNYEIVISDNSDGDETEVFAKELSDKGINIIYYKNRVKGFYNSIKVLSLGRGALLKLQNDYSRFIPGEFYNLIQLVKREIKNKPIIFFSNGTLSSNFSEKYFSTKNEFIRATSYQNTWSSAFSIWREDFISTPHQVEDVDSMFPHTSLLFNAEKESYLIDNRCYMNNKVVKNKGGYNIFYNFCILYFNILKEMELKGKISKITFFIIKYDMLINFITPWYYRTILTEQGYTFDSSKADEYIKCEYGVLLFTAMKCVGMLKRMFRRENIED